mgnify:FL=1
MLRADNEGGVQMAQSRFIRRVCGRPCSADYYLHTESLLDDWLHLLSNLSLPLVGLPRVNPTAINGQVPRTIFTKEVVDIIHRLDANMFSEFGYKKRTDAPFELT